VHPLDGRADDTVFYFASARWLGESFEYRDLWGRLTAHWPPGYPLLISPVFWFSESLTAVKAINVIAAAVTLVIVFLFASRAFDTATGLFAACCWRSCPATSTSRRSS
jgi:asparagine N-glycosylation enzyme membrane subunit Stt3